MHLDSDLKWKTQVNNVAVKLRKANGVLCKIRHFVPESVRTLVYYGIFYCHLMYCCQIWGQHVEGVSETLLKRIKVLQNIALRLITFSNYRDHASPLYSYLSVIKFRDIVQRQNVLFLHDVYNGIIPSDVVNTLNIDFSHFYNTRASSRGQINSVYRNTSTYGDANWRIQSIASWNKCQKLIPETQFFEMTGPKLKEALTSAFIRNY